MGIVAGIGAAAAAGSLASSISNLSGGSGGTGGFSGGSSPPPVYIPANQPGMDTNFQNLFGSIYPTATTLPGQIAPQYESAAQSIIGNPYAAGVQQGGVTAGNYLTGSVAPMQAGGASSLYGGAQVGVPFESAILNQGFDPQSALYNRALSNLTEQTQAALAQSGVGNTPYGVGVLGQTLGNFGIDWNAQQLQNMVNATGGYGNLVNATGRGFAGASDLGTAAGGTISAGTQLPYTSYNLPYNTNLSTLGSEGTGITSLFNLPSSLFNPIESYLGLGQSATGIGQAGAAQNFQNQAYLGQQLGQSLGALGGYASNLFGSSPSSNYGYNYANTVDQLNSGGYYGPTDASGALLYG